MLGTELKAVRAVFHCIFMTALRATALFFLRIDYSGWVRLAVLDRGVGPG